MVDLYGNQLPSRPKSMHYKVIYDIIFNCITHLVRDKRGGNCDAHSIYATDTYKISQSWGCVQKSGCGSLDAYATHVKNGEDQTIPKN